MSEVMKNDVEYYTRKDHTFCGSKNCTGKGGRNKPDNNKKLGGVDLSDIVWIDEKVPENCALDIINTPEGKHSIAILTDRETLKFEESDLTIKECGVNAVQVCELYKPDWFHKLMMEGRIIERPFHTYDVWTDNDLNLATRYDYIIYEDDKLSVMGNVEFEELYDRNVYE